MNKVKFTENLRLKFLVQVSCKRGSTLTKIRTLQAGQNEKSKTLQQSILNLTKQLKVDTYPV